MAENDDLASVIAETAMSDPAMQKAVRNLAIMAIRKTHHFLQNGSPQVQMQILRSFIPALIREMSKGDESDGHDQLRAEFESLRREMMEGMDEANPTG
jgi:hypothetical protein